MRNKILILLLLFLNVYPYSYGQAINDYGAITSGTWTTTTIWRQWDGIGWNTIPISYPNASTSNVWILDSSIVTVPGNINYNISSLRVKPLGKLYANSTTQVYLSVYGSNITCDGEIGNGLNSDGLSFNIEGQNCTITGVGTFTASRIRKSAIINPSTTLIIAMNVDLRWSVQSATAIYNNVTTGNSRFDVTVNSGCTLNVAGSPTTPANLSVDGLSGNGGVGVYDASGTYNINGTLIVTGIIYATTDNTNAGYSASFNINKNAIAKVGQINSPNSGNSGMVFKVDTNATLELTGPNGFYFTGGATTWGTTNNRYNFLPGSTVKYSAMVNQSILSRTNFNSATAPNNDYWNLITSGSGTKTILTNILLNVRNDLTINSPAVLDQAINSPDIWIGGNWLNWNQSGFNQSPNKKVQFQGDTSFSRRVQTITCPGGEIFSNLTIAKPTGSIFTSVKLLSPITVTKILTLGGQLSSYGILELNGNSLTLTNPSTSAITLLGYGSYNRFIISEDTLKSSIKWYVRDSLGSFIIPFGINFNEDTIPFVYIKTNNNNIDTLTVSTYGTPSNNLPWPSQPVNVTNLNAFITANNAPDNRDWTIDRFWYIGTTNPPINDSVKFYYNNRINTDTELPINDPDPKNMLAQYWDWNNSTWHYPMQYGQGNSPNYVISPLITTNTIWTLSSSGSPLPIELLNFYGRHYGENIKLFWSTSCEINNDYFIIYKSYDGIQYDELDHVDGAGNSNVRMDYQYLDNQICDTIVYYKLRQVDYDGKYTESDPIAIQCNHDDNKNFEKCYDILGREINDDEDYSGIKIYRHE